MSLQQSLRIVLVVKNDSGIGDRVEDLLSLIIGEIMNSVVDVIVEAEWPFEFEGWGLVDFLLLGVVVSFLHDCYTICKVWLNLYFKIDLIK